MTVSRRDKVTAAITANAANGMTHVNTVVIAALVAMSNPNHSGRNHTELRSDISGSSRETASERVSPQRLPATVVVDNGGVNLDNMRTHEPDDP
jgi:hypothetical protein